MAQHAPFSATRVLIWLAPMWPNAHHWASGVPSFLFAKVKLHMAKIDNHRLVVPEVLNMSGKRLCMCNLYLTEFSGAFLFPKVKKCNPVDIPRGFLSCSNPNGPFTFGSVCTATCERGFALNGTVSIECSSLGLWSADIPQCLGKEIVEVSKYLKCFSIFFYIFFVCLSAKQCPALGSPAHGSLVCSAPHGEFSFGAQCRSTCNEGFLLNGTADTECTSQGMWSTETPHCLGKKSYIERNYSCLHEERPIYCSMHGGVRLMPRVAQPCPLLAKAPPNGLLTCSHPHSHSSYGSRCEFECDAGFWLRGASAITCNSSGVWSRDPPACQGECLYIIRNSDIHHCSHTRSAHQPYSVRPSVFSLHPCLWTAPILWKN